MTSGRARAPALPVVTRRTAERLRAAAATALLIGTPACAHYPVNRSLGYQGTPMTVQVEDVPAKGFHVDVSAKQGDVSGELLAVSPEQVYVLTARGMRAVPTAEVHDVSIRLYDSGWGWLAGWTALGTVSTASHGVFLVFSAPLWLVVGISATANASSRSSIPIRGPGLPGLWQFARFPAGLPEGWTDAPP